MNRLKFFQNRGVLFSDPELRHLIKSDDLHFEADPHIQARLEQMVINRGRAPISQNSILEFFLPLFSLRYFERKMAVISIALFVMIGVSTTTNRPPDRNLNLFSLADTLDDTTAFHVPAIRDTALYH